MAPYDYVITSQTLTSTLSSPFCKMDACNPQRKLQYTMEVILPSEGYNKIESPNQNGAHKTKWSSKCDIYLCHTNLSHLSCVLARVAIQV